MLIFGLLKTSSAGGGFGWDKRTQKAIPAKKSPRITIIPKKAALCLCFGDMNTTAIILITVRFYLQVEAVYLLDLYLIAGKRIFQKAVCRACVKGNRCCFKNAV